MPLFWNDTGTIGQAAGAVRSIKMIPTRAMRPRTPGATWRRSSDGRATQFVIAVDGDRVTVSRSSGSHDMPKHLVLRLLESRGTPRRVVDLDEAAPLALPVSFCSCSAVSRGRHGLPGASMIRTTRCSRIDDEHHHHRPGVFVRRSRPGRQSHSYDYWHFARSCGGVAWVRRRNFARRPACNPRRLLPDGPVSAVVCTRNRPNLIGQAVQACTSPIRMRASTWLSSIGVTTMSRTASSSI